MCQLFDISERERERDRKRGKEGEISRMIREEALCFDT